MGGSAKRRATYEDLLAVPAHLVAEIDDAKVRVEPFEAFELELAGLWAK
jgi:hypothetical protein